MSKQKVYFPFSLNGRIGELAWQILMIRNIYPIDQYDVIILSRPIDDKVNTLSSMAVFDFVTRGLKTIIIPFNHSPKDFIPHNEENFIFVSHSAGQLAQVFLEKVRDAGVAFRYSLSEDDIRKGQLLRAKLSIPQESKIVTINVRHDNFLAELAYHKFRNANILTYAHAISFLLQKGYYVVRLGDKSSPPIKANHEHFIDAPHHDKYDKFFEVYFIGCSDFYIGQASGPTTIANGFGTPTLLTNSFPQACLWSNAVDLHLYKKYYSEKLNRNLTYEEIVCSDLPDFGSFDLYDQSGIKLIDNSAEEILAGTIEMVENIEKLRKRDESLEQKVREINYKADVLRRHMDAKNRNSELFVPFFPIYSSGVQLSQEFIRLNPGYLGHPFPAINWERPLGTVLDLKVVYQELYDEHQKKCSENLTI
jgi:putative glycosyltransferase (TIGR04372 family)